MKDPKEIRMNSFMEKKHEAEIQIRDAVSAVCTNFTKETGFSIASVYVSFLEVTRLGQPTHEHALQKIECEVDLR